MLYRFEHEGIGIYEAVDKHCPPDDPRRQNKPDGSWLQKAGLRFPSAISYWTEVGLEKYRTSGLLAWHLSVLTEGSIGKRCYLTGDMLYNDDFQIIADINSVQTIEIVPAINFLSQ